ncbi:MAG: hypothetical protein ACJ79S_13290 [Gemmatimonadaceae bacterium]
MPRVAALFRSPAYSPNQHRVNDTAILELTLAELARDGWEVVRVEEGALAGAADDGGPPTAVLPDAALYLNMCQGERANRRLLGLEASGAALVNGASAILRCHRHRLVPALAARGVRFPETEIHELAERDADAVAAWPLVRAAAGAGRPLWIKRGDVHAERDEDVVAVAAERVPEALAAFAARGIARVAVQEHVDGPVLKLYAVAGGRFFRYYDAAAGPRGARPDVDVERLRALAFDAAAALGLDVFGGDVALPRPDDPVLIDLNDWPSFAPFRAEAAAAIARHAQGVHARTASRGAVADRSLLGPEPASGPTSELASDVA